MTSFELRDFRIDRMTLAIERNAFGDCVVTVTMRVPSVEDGRIITVHSDATVDAYALERDVTSDLLRHIVKDALLSALEHELHEKLYVDGERLRDPHPEEPESR